MTNNLKVSILNLLQTWLSIQIFCILSVGEWHLKIFPKFTKDEVKENEEKSGKKLLFQTRCTCEWPLYTFVLNQFQYGQFPEKMCTWASFSKSALDFFGYYNQK